MENELKDVQNKQQQRITQSSSFQQHLTATTDNLANDIESLEKEFNAVQNKQREIINRDINTLKSNLATTTNNLGNIFDVLDMKLNSTEAKQLELTLKIINFTNNVNLLDQKIETVQQKQFELSRLSEGNDQKINVLWTNLTDEIHHLSKKLNSTQEEQLELASRVRDHGHGNKDRIDQLAIQISQVFGNITDLSSKMNSTNSARPLNLFLVVN